MSIFDPQGIYFHRQKSTKKGQILQKRPKSNQGAIKMSEVPRSVNVLKTYGFTVIPPGGQPPSPEPVARVARYSINTTLQNNLTAQGSKTITFNNIWGVIKNNFMELLEIPLEQVTVGQVTISITCVQFPVQISAADNIQVITDGFTDNTQINYNNTQIIYTSYNSTQCRKAVFSNNGMTAPTTLSNTGYPFVVAEYTSLDWQQLVEGTLDQNHTLLTAQRTSGPITTYIGNMVYTVYAEAVVNYLS